MSSSSQQDGIQEGDEEEGRREGVDDDEEDDIQYGIRQAIRDTSYHYRDSSSLTPAQIMERDTYYQAAEDILELCALVVQIMFTAFNAHNHIRALIGRWRRIGDDAMSAAIEAMHTKMMQLKDFIEKLTVMLTWIQSYGELALLAAEDRAVFIRRRHRFHPERYRTLDEITRNDCYSWFGLNKHSLHQLYVAWRIPQILRSSSRHSFGGEECFIIFLFHMNKGTQFTEMARH